MMWKYPFNNYQTMDICQIYEIKGMSATQSIYLTSDVDLADAVAYLDFQAEAMINLPEMPMSNLVMGYALTCLYGCGEAGEPFDDEPIIVIDRCREYRVRQGEWYQKYVVNGENPSIARSDIELLAVLGPYVESVKRDLKEHQKRLKKQKEL